ncbi:MAG: maleylacetate reductase [Thermoleophilaceae bacterium]|nr:maleylacetate reductase [Thermoleophilaceae bacterium]
MAEDFTWRDGGRVVRFGSGVAAEAPGLVDDDFLLLTTERAASALPALTEAAAGVVHVPPGRVDEISADLLGDVSAGASLVALGGGRVIDTAKAVAGALGSRVAAIPTTLSGAELTPFHRTPAGVEGARLVSPALVIADPDLMASAPPATLAATAMNALAHAMEALYTPLANPVTTMTALRAAALLARGLTSDPPDREALALGAVLAGYSSGCTGIAVHHAICQTIVRTADTPHAETNAVMLPHSARLMVDRAPGALSSFTEALGTDLGQLAARCGHTRLSTLGVGEEQLPGLATAVAAHPLLANTPDPPDEAELLSLLRDAL